MSNARLELQQLVSKFQKSDTLVSENHAINVVESLVTKSFTGKLDPEQQAFYELLQEKGFISK
jgi:hypothetical protein